MATGEVVGGILLAGDQLLRMEQLTVRTRADLIDHRRLQVDEDTSRHVLAGARLGEEGVERIITATDSLVAPKFSGQKLLCQRPTSCSDPVGVTQTFLVYPLSFFPIS